MQKNSYKNSSYLEEVDTLDELEVDTLKQKQKNQPSSYTKL